MEIELGRKRRFDDEMEDIGADISTLNYDSDDLLFRFFFSHFLIKRCRDRINAQLSANSSLNRSTLRKLIPKSEKMDKAAPLGHVVDHVKEQRQRAKEASKISSGVPSEIDEVIVDQIEDGSEQIKSSIRCDDRPELFAEIGSALKALEATIVEANISKHTHQHPHNP
ncbi:transcription factor bHLH51-like [Salvia splendens]|uniref:transcription factor bHLH51-like n=1 Tax=Salvia splendens TaxID=180675 RepID=UPI001C276974|nr:transcription factor bHLH51-like [Salvia splendens]